MWIQKENIPQWISLAPCNLFVQFEVVVLYEDSFILPIATSGISLFLSELRASITSFSRRIPVCTVWTSVWTFWVPLLFTFPPLHALSPLQPLAVAYRHESHAIVQTLVSFHLACLTRSSQYSHIHGGCRWLTLSPIARKAYHDLAQPKWLSIKNHPIHLDLLGVVRWQPSMDDYHALYQTIRLNIAIGLLPIILLCKWWQHCLGWH